MGWPIWLASYLANRPMTQLTEKARNSRPKASQKQLIPIKPKVFQAHGLTHHLSVQNSDRCHHVRKWRDSA